MSFSGKEMSNWQVFLAVAILAWNSVIARLAFVEQTIDPGSFALIRLTSGAVALWLILLSLGRAGQFRLLDISATVKSAVAISVYMVFFAFAHTRLDAGAGALIQFAVVQVVMFGAAFFVGETIPKTRSIGAFIALIGLAVMLWPKGANAPEMTAVMAMIAAASGWAMYSFYGRQTRYSMASTGANFALALPVSLVMLLILPHDGPVVLTEKGIVLALLSGAVTSGLSYSYWYSILPRTKTSIAGVAQLLIPTITMLGGMVILDEVLTMRFLVSLIILVFGVGLSFGYFTPGKR